MVADRTETQARAKQRQEAAAAPTLFVVLHARHPQAPAARIRISRSMEIGRGPAFSASPQRLDIPDSVMSSRHTTIKPVLDGFVLEDTGSKNGTHVNGVRQTQRLLRDGDWIELGNTLLRFRAAIAGGELPCLAEQRDDSLATTLPELAGTYERVAQMATAGVPLLVLGETGTGKELIARAIHDTTGRGGPFVAINCGALPATLVESELFGHRRGAFSGATDDRPGLFRAADRGTLLLDEIGELPLPAQAALLRVLQQREVTPVGGDRPIPIDVRIVAATHRDLEAAVAAGTFREDLFARLAGQIVRIPPLRERLEDLGLIIGGLLRRLGKPNATLEIEAARAFTRHAWPRNVRELEMGLTAALAIDPACIKLANLPETITSEAAASRSSERDDDVARKTAARGVARRAPRQCQSCRRGDGQGAVTRTEVAEPLRSRSCSIPSMKTVPVASRCTSSDAPGRHD